VRVELEAVRKCFGSVVALREVSWTLASGSRCALIGPNGAGKSTLTRVLMGMLGCDGTVSLDGRSPFLERRELSHRIAYVPQVAPQLGATVAELVRTVARLRGIPVGRFTELAEQLELDISAVRRRSLRDLSGGMRQKLLLALALATEASLLILDEPTASLDPGARRRFFELVGELPHEPTIVLCSHRLEELRHLVDRVLVLEDGAVSYDGGAAEYLRRTALGVLEVMADGARANRWLEDRGFRRGASGWWTHAVQNGRRVGLLNETLEALGGDIVDVLVREDERLGGER